ncbi:hypothetical protein Malapachy_2413 [Malassezia pachydermatis]|uniref:Dolichyl-diphosphooligosaccharide-protein glycosyltransferase subunit OST5 n=1 Tax=Malassezia pachydermatis TaxID=77020 RepID=A0A0M8MP91_9BASI|nr:hypothetical protein Malapachy_2413 [Malassezia pachydermatis]KOS15568.1 hypothetical protein Malapachy_2413 [Malassezia pachydermatis]
MSALQQLYETVQKDFMRLPVKVPTISPDAMPVIATVSLGLAFFLAFYFTTLPKQGGTIKEPISAILGSTFAGIGVVALFNAVGVYV